MATACGILPAWKTQELFPHRPIASEFTQESLKTKKTSSRFLLLRVFLGPWLAVMPTAWKMPQCQMPHAPADNRKNRGPRWSSSSKTAWAPQPQPQGGEGPYLVLLEDNDTFSGQHAIKAVRGTIHPKSYSQRSRSFVLHLHLLHMTKALCTQS